MSEFMAGVMSACFIGAVLYGFFLGGRYHELKKFKKLLNLIKAKSEEIKKNSKKK